MDRKAELRDKSRKLSAEINKLQAERNAVEDELEKIEIAEDRAKFTCSCVKLNDEIGIFNMGAQARARREPLGYSCGRLVCRTLTAFKDCPTCYGTGKPVPAVTGRPGAA